MLVVLRAHRGEKREDDPAGTATPATFVRETLPEDTPDAAGRKRLERDLAVLRELGLVRTNLPTGSSGFRDGIDLVIRDKPVQWELTVREHRALWAARRALRPRETVPTALPATAAPGHERLDLVLRLLRIGEEAGPDVVLSVPELARLTGAPRAAVQEALEQLDGLASDFRSTSDSLVSVEVIWSDSDAGGPVALRVRREGLRLERSPAVDRGLDEVGRFAYTRAECDDRLGLIEQALTGWAQQQDLANGPGRDDERFVTVLEEARHKLASWRRALDESAGDEAAATA